ncbi:MAG: CD225/dispanin family protein [Polyangiales bacterium]
MPPGMGGDVNTTLPLVLSILSIFPCGCTCLGGILGIIGLVFSIQAMNAKTAGDFTTAQSQAKTATILSGVGIGIGALLWIAQLVTGFAQGMLQNGR